MLTSTSDRLRGSHCLSTSMATNDYRSKGPCVLSCYCHVVLLETVLNIPLGALLRRTKLTACGPPLYLEASVSSHLASHFPFYEDKIIHGICARWQLFDSLPHLCCHRMTG